MRTLKLGFTYCMHKENVVIILACRLAEWVAFLYAAVTAAVAMCRVRTPACIATSALGKERYVIMSILHYDKCKWLTRSASDAYGAIQIKHIYKMFNLGCHIVTLITY